MGVAARRKKPTNRREPEEMPSTKGPAMGFLKKVWSRKPAMDSAPPSRAAPSRRDRRIFQRILPSVVPSLPQRRRVSMRSRLRCTEPVLMFQ